MSIAVEVDLKEILGQIKLWDLNLDSLMAKSCDWVRSYLQNPTAKLSESDRHLCDGIGTKQ
jgi:hypothetical protein